MPEKELSQGPPPPALTICKFFPYVSQDFIQSVTAKRKEKPEFFPCLKIPRHLASVYSLSAGTETASTP